MTSQCIPAWQERRDAYMWTVTRCWERQTHPRRCAGTDDPDEARRLEYAFWGPRLGRENLQGHEPSGGL